MSDDSQDDVSRSADDWLTLSKAAERRGELLAAYDLADQGLRAHSDHIWLKHRAVLALARSGATHQALDLFHRLGLADRPEEDVAALGARLAKDLALSVEGSERRRRASRASRAYAAVYERTGGYYPAINAATLSLVAGDPARAADLSRLALDSCGRAEAEYGREDFYIAATRAEANLLLGEIEAAGAALERAVKLHEGDFGAVATARKQLRLICEIQDTDQSLLAALATPTVAHFVGHMIHDSEQAANFTEAKERGLAERVAAVIADRNIGYGYGSLACGSDIIIAEALLAQGAELHVILPFNNDEFRTVSVAPGGIEWLARFDDCMSKAKSVTYATEDSYLGDNELFFYSGQLAMGLALLRARYLDTAVEQLAVWDGQPTRQTAATAVEVAFWKSLGFQSQRIDCEGLARRADAATETSDLQRPGPVRVVRAMLFGDIRGFSKLRDSQLPHFVEAVMGKFAGVLDAYGERVLYRNTWGDAVYVVLPDVATAANCALDLQHAMASINLTDEKLPEYLALRLGGHLGPVFEGQDPILREPAFFGSQVSRTARIEPVTPPGATYVTEAFAAALALVARACLACEYVGHMEAAKGYGTMRMYVLKRTPRHTKVCP